MLRGLVRQALELGNRSNEDARRARPPRADRLGGDSEPMQAVRRTIAKVARSQAPVHITGESGTGKELARAPSTPKGPRAAGPFVPVNCGAIPAELMESEFFGHKKGSFTGAHADKTGCSRPPRAAPCSSTKSPNCRCRCR